MLDFVPFAGAGRKVTNRDSQSGLISEFLQLQFPQPQPPAIAPARIGGNPDRRRLRVQPLAFMPPPAADRRHGERAGVVIGAEVERLEVPVHRWHGDVSSSHKRQVLSDPAGILLITPESLEALFVLRGTAIAGFRLTETALTIIVNDISADDLISRLRALAAQGPADAVELAATGANKLLEKHHPFLNDELLSLDYASSRLDPEGAWQAVARVVGQVEAL